MEDGNNIDERPALILYLQSSLREFPRPFFVPIVFWW